MIFDTARLMALRGSGGSDNKRRKIVDNGANMLERSQRIGAADLREMREDARDTGE